MLWFLRWSTSSCPRWCQRQPRPSRILYQTHYGFSWPRGISEWVKEWVKEWKNFQRIFKEFSKNSQRMIERSPNPSLPSRRDSWWGDRGSDRRTSPHLRQSWRLHVGQWSIYKGSGEKIRGEFPFGSTNQKSSSRVHWQVLRQDRQEVVFHPLLVLPSSSPQRPSFAFPSDVGFPPSWSSYSSRWRCQPSCQWMNDWMNEWLNEWMIEWMNDWLNHLQDERQRQGQDGHRFDLLRGQWRLN